jgi:hypothetical protein
VKGAFVSFKAMTGLPTMNRPLSQMRARPGPAKRSMNARSAYLLRAPEEAPMNLPM